VPFLQSVNIGAARSINAKSGRTGIDKQPVTDPVSVRAPGPKGNGGAGIIGDKICDKPNHGGNDQAVYAYAREDLDDWERELGRELRSGMFGENLTTSGIDVTGAVIGERWHIGTAVLEVSCPRIPCVTFETWMQEPRWVKTFTRRAVPGAYLRIVQPGQFQVNDTVQVTDRPGHEVTIGLAFRAVTLEPDLLPLLLQAEAFPEPDKETVRKRVAARS
jgi:MOSC domain-containing protein YiiM